MSALVSVLVITYNSSQHIVDTLESIKRQTYKRLELVISDDCSLDNTLDIIKEWIVRNSDRFERIKICKGINNNGIPNNLNKGIKECDGFYIKSIAGDDILDDRCIELNASKCRENKYRILFSRYKVFYENEFNFKYDIEYLEEIKYFDYPAKKQARILSVRNFVLAPTFFVEKNLLEELNYFDEKYKYMEDYPMWIKITESGIKLNYFDEVTVYYREHSMSVSHMNKNNNEVIGNIRFYLCKRSFFYNERLKKLIKYGMFYSAYKQIIIYIYNDLVLKSGNKRNVITNIYKILLLLNPELVYLKIKNSNNSILNKQGISEAKKYE